MLIALSKSIRPIYFLLFICLFSACSSLSFLVQKNKAWTQQLGRKLEKDNLVIVSSATDKSEKTAKFKSEAIALEDLANECSFVIKGTQIEEELTQVNGDNYNVFVRVSVRQSLCEKAKQSISMEEIEKFANLGYSEQILKNQNDKDNDAALTIKLSGKEKVEKILSSDAKVPIRDDNDFFMTKQQIAFLKQSILASSKGLFLLKLTESDKMRQVLVEKIKAMSEYESMNPALKSSSITWFSVRERWLQNSKQQELETVQNKTTQNKTTQKERKNRSTRKPAEKKNDE